MKKSVAMKWVKALRSGEYKQGANALRVEDRFCCLGVLCDITQQGKWVPHKSEVSQYAYTTQLRQINVGSLPNAVIYFSKFKNKQGEGEYQGSNGWRSLVDYNDKGVPFEEIADWIEKYYEVL